MSRRMIGRAIVLTLVSGILFIGFIYVFFPAGRIDAAIARILEPQGLKLLPNAKKTLLPGLVWDRLELLSDRGTLVRCDRLLVRPLLLPLLTGRAVFSGTAAIGSGEMIIQYTLNGSDAVNFTADGINVSDIPFFNNVLGAKSAGVLWSQGKLRRATKGLNGEVKLEVKQLEFSGVRLGSFPLPDVSGLKTQGMVRVADGRTRLESLTLEGDGIYMRLSGDLPSGANAGAVPLNMSLEIMPKAEFLEKQKMVFLLLTKFMTSPGVYRLPVRGTLLKPEIL